MTELITDETAITVGSLARVIRRTHLGEDVLREGAQVEIEYFVNADEAEDGIPFYWVICNDSNRAVKAEDLEVIKTAEEMRARRTPTNEVLMDFISSEVLNSGDTFEIHSTDRDGKNLEIYGRTNDGLNFGFVLSISDIHKTDF